jgi:hypothetical protein
LQKKITIFFSQQSFIVVAVVAEDVAAVVA